ncbi:hypothetical protein F5890DRAFT_584954 [Lentinula detonsa]|uniref:Uncharacterized protein n=1 Tax=Lentinula detonsa TaxID=2804962 RepID=A0AA38Q6A0_9AGAR|nr:hypothetical protein F5890DRAFT_584954 [Lentinula detonsa]
MEALLATAFYYAALLMFLSNWLSPRIMRHMKDEHGEDTNAKDPWIFPKYKNTCRLAYRLQCGFQKEERKYIAKHIPKRTPSGPGCSPPNESQDGFLRTTTSSTGL